MQMKCNLCSKKEIVAENAIVLPKSGDLVDVYYVCDDCSANIRTVVQALQDGKDILSGFVEASAIMQYTKNDLQIEETQNDVENMAEQWLKRYQ